MTSFGESAPAPALFEHFGFTLDNVLAVAEELLEDDAHALLAGPRKPRQWRMAGPRGPGGGAHRAPSFLHLQSGGQAAFA